MLQKEVLFKRYPLSFAGGGLLTLSYVAFFASPGIGTILGFMFALTAIGISIAGILKEPSKNPALLVHVMSVLSLVVGVLFFISFFSSWRSGNDSLDMM